MHGHGLHHLQKRKRISRGEYPPYPHPNKLKRFLDGAMYFIAIGTPLITTPQVVEIWSDKNAAGVSVISWGGYLAFTIFWLIYGVVHKEKPIIITNILWIFFEIAVIWGAVVYG